jgi:predicted nucleic acid-binding protein
MLDSLSVTAFVTAAGVRRVVAAPQPRPGLGFPKIHRYGVFCAELEKAGTPIGSIDHLIADIARANTWTVVTGNLHEFRRVKRLKCEQWHA